MLSKRIENWETLEDYACKFHTALVIDSDEKLEEVIQYLYGVLDKVENGQTEYEPLLEAVALIVARYEDEHIPMPNISPIRYLKHLMDNHGHTVSDLSDVAEPEVINEILEGKREFELVHIKALAKKYGVSYNCFIDDE